MSCTLDNTIYKQFIASFPSIACIWPYVQSMYVSSVNSNLGSPVVCSLMSLFARRVHGSSPRVPSIFGTPYRLLHFTP